jgi:hypothetical protein
MVGPLHAALVHVEQQENRSSDRHDGKDPGNPSGSQDSAGPLQLNDAKDQKNHGVAFVLKNLTIGREGGQPALLAKWPEFRVAPD